MALLPTITIPLAAASDLAERSAVALDAFVAHIEPIARVREVGAWCRGLIAAVALHVAVLAAFAVPSFETSAGGGGTELAAISVDIVSGAAVEALTAAATADAAATSRARLASVEGGERQQTAALEMPDRPEERTPATPASAEIADLIIPDMIIRPEPPIPDAPSIVIAAKPVEQPVEGPEKPVDATAKLEASTTSTPSAPSDAAIAEQIGGATSRGSSVVELAAQSAAIASAGEIAAYARRVQLAVANNPPKPPRAAGVKGDVVITFALGPDGSLAFARVLSSSGDGRLDDAALAAVRRTQFPTPPHGSQAAQLIYKFPVKFVDPLPPRR